MAKFISLDGVDAAGVRAEVSVQTGRGRIKELNRRGDGRNVEVVFDPDNPHLKRKVYALLDTTATELWDYVQAAHAEGRDIAFRIESQRKRGVDRTIKFEDLSHAEQVVRVLAAIDHVFSPVEAKTDPAEDPTGEAPSALAQHRNPATAPAAASVTLLPASAAGSPAAALDALAAARRAGLGETTIDTLIALALHAGATVEQVTAAGFDGEDSTPARTRTASTAFAVEEKPWMLLNSDGRPNAGSYAVAAAGRAEEFAVAHLAARTDAPTVSEDVIDAAGSLAAVLLELADTVQAAVTGRADRQKNSYRRALSVVIDTVERRHPAPVDAAEDAVAQWKGTVVAEAGARLTRVVALAHGSVETPAAAPEAKVETQDAPAAPEATAAAETPAAPARGPKRPAVPATDTPAAAGADLPAPAPAPARAARRATAAAAPATPAPAAYQLPSGAPEAGDPDFEAPSAAVVARLRDLCQAAGLGADDRDGIREWLTRHIGVTAAKNAHAPVLEGFVAHYERAGADAVRAEVRGATAA